MHPPPFLAHNLLLQGELLRLARGLTQAGIDFVVLKGVVLLRRVYGSLDARAVSDNDLLIRPSDVPRALAALEALGYRPKPQAALEDALREDAKYVLVRRHLNRDLWLDVHTSPLVPTIHRSAEELVWRHTETLVLEGVSLRVTSPEMTLLHLVAHAEQHRFCEPRILKDIAATWRAWPHLLDQGRLLGLAAQLRLQHALDYVLGALHALHLVEGPLPFIGSCRARRLERLLPADQLLVSATPYGRESYKRGLLTLLLRDPDRIAAQLRKDLFPPLSKLAVIYNQPARPALYLRYATRPFRPVARYFGYQP